MKIILLFACFICHTSCRPSDPVIRVFGTQPDNPNVKVFSTYPTEKPVQIKDNPNDLQKGNEKEEKTVKDEEIEEREIKGQEIPKAGLDQVKPNSSSVQEENVEESVPADGDEIDNSQPSAHVSHNSSHSDSSNSDHQEERDTKETDDNIMIEEITPSSGDEEIVPIAVEVPLNTLPPMTENEFKEEEVFTSRDLIQPIVAGIAAENEEMGTKVERFQDEEGEENLESGINHNEQDSKLEEKHLETSNSNDEQALKNIMEPVKPAAEVFPEEVNPMASFQERVNPLDPIAESDNNPLFSEGDIESSTTAGLEENALGEIGVTVPISESIMPIVEVDSTPEQDEEMELKNKTKENSFNISKQRFSIKIKVADEEPNETYISEKRENETQLQPDPDQEPIQMAGFMADISKSSRESPAINVEDEEDSSTQNPVTEIPSDVEPMTFEDSTIEEGLPTEVPEVELLEEEIGTENEIQATTEDSPTLNTDEPLQNSDNDSDPNQA